MTDDDQKLAEQQDELIAELEMFIRHIIWDENSPKGYAYEGRERLKAFLNKIIKEEW